MSCNRVVVLALLLAALVQRLSGVPDAIGWEVKAFKSSEEEVAYLMEQSKRAILPINDPTPLVLNRRMAANPRTYYPLVYEQLVTAKSMEEASIAAAYLTVFKDTNAAEIRSLFLRMIRGEFDEASFLPDKGESLGAVVIDHRLFGAIAEPSDAWELLPHIEAEYGNSALVTITQIADPSIIPALEAAVRRRTEKFPQYYTNVEGYLSHNLPLIAKEIRERSEGKGTGSKGKAITVEIDDDLWPKYPPLEFDSPEAVVEYIFSPRAEDIPDRRPGQVQSMVKAQSDIYFPLFYKRLVQARSIEEASGAARLLGMFRDTHEAEVRDIYLQMLKGEFHECPALADGGAALTELIVCVALRFVGRAEDAWTLLPYVETDLFDCGVVETIAAIAEPSILPKLVEAIGGRYNEQYIEEWVVGRILARHGGSCAEPQESGNPIIPTTP